MNVTKAFWGEQGRLARITQGEFAGRYLYVYPETVEPWWTAFVAPSFNADAPGEIYVDSVEGLMRIERDWGLVWLDQDEVEADLERAYFGVRPLTGPPSWLCS